jgi:hypothetical protein
MSLLQLVALGAQDRFLLNLATQTPALYELLTTTTGLALPFVAIQMTPGITPAMTPVITPIYRQITNNDKITCSITQCEIVINERYMNCVQCSNNYMEESIKNWFVHRPHRKSCPMCRTNWSDFNVYINGHNEEENDDENVEEPIVEEPMNEETYEAIGIREPPPIYYAETIQTGST